MRFFAVALIFFGVTASYAQAPVVPHKMHFADMTLAIRDEARREIQKDVDALVRNPKYFDQKVERAKRYFPIINQIFAEENVPEDLKYLVLQESSLVADAVSVSNAVGFWQFKDFTAISMGLRVDSQIDERMNIFSASRGAAKYLKQNNQQFDNWILALQAYQMGAGGAKRSVGDRHNGKRHFEVTADTYWYIKKFIAHKVAFENAVDGPPQITAAAIELRASKSLAEVAKEVNVEESILREYNKWALTGMIPDDRAYVVVVPNGVMNGITSPAPVLASKKASKAKPMAPRKEQQNREVKFINGLRAIKALEGESLVGLTNQAGITLARFLKFNEMQIDHSVEAGAFYFMERKKTSSTVLQHKVKIDDDLWSISQQYGIQLKKIKKWNRGVDEGRLQVGSIVWLTSKKQVDQPMQKLPEVPNEQIASLAQESFNWEVTPTSHSLHLSDSAEIQIIQQKEIIQQAAGSVNESQLVTEHTVEKGETLYSLAKSYRVSVVDVAKWNSLSINGSLTIGQKIILYPQKIEEKLHASPAPEVNPTANNSFTHTVTQQDTLYAIARQYGVTIKDLMDWNDKKELSVKEGEKIRVKRK
ncbi:MAG: LysM peptidoglycan-binding domain-containing protein [Flammeovirgaceae bacterium]|jgi:membrane-bound lytic murein transglycosylase D|nr:LysM peptidoglycan-binding domain-containing protein [Flammeovirgaceae bacterium]